MEPAVLREDMVDSLEHEVKGHLTSPRLSLAMREVPRHRFVKGEGAYEDVARRRHGSTVLAPSAVAVLFEALSPDPSDDVLIVGAGVGYTAAVAAELTDARQVHAIDIDRRLVLDARNNLRRAGYREVLVDRRDGAEGLPEYAPYDRILVEAAAVSPPRRLHRQLAADGRLVMPTGVSEQVLGVYDEEGLLKQGDPVRFRPLLVEGEQPAALERNRTEREDTERAERAASRAPGWEHEWLDWSAVDGNGR